MDYVLTASHKNPYFYFRFILQVKNIFLVILLLIYLWGCSQPIPIDNQNLIIINAPVKKESNIKLSSLVDSIYYIPLETKDEFLIGNIDKLIVTDKEIYVLDKNITTATYCFDQKGKFVRKIGNRGASDKEYISITDINIHNGKMYIWDGDVNKLLIYNSNGEYIKTITSKYSAETFAVINDSEIAFYGDYKHNHLFLEKDQYPNLLFLNTQNKDSKSDLFFSSELSTSGIWGLPNNLTNNKNLIIPLNDTIYQILDSFHLKRKFVMNYGENYQKAQREYIKKQKSENVSVDEAMNMLGDGAQFPVLTAYYEGSYFSYFFYRIGFHAFFGFYYPESQTYIEASAYQKSPIENDMDGLARFLPYAVHKNTLYSIMEPSSIIGHTELIPVSEKAKLEKLTLEDNPVIVAIKMKKI